MLLVSNLRLMQNLDKNSYVITMKNSPIEYLALCLLMIVVFSTFNLCASVKRVSFTITSRIFWSFEDTCIKCQFRYLAELTHNNTRRVIVFLWIHYERKKERDILFEYKLNYHHISIVISKFFNI